MPPVAGMWRFLAVWNTGWILLGTEDRNKQKSCVLCPFWSHGKDNSHEENPNHI